MANRDSEALLWLCKELLGECLRLHSFSVVHEFLPTLNEFERDWTLQYLFWQSLIGKNWWLAELCLENGVSLTPQEISDCGPLHTAMSNCVGSAHVIAWLIANGAEIERRAIGSSNATPLIHAVALGMNEIVTMLLEHGADPKARTVIDDDETALMIAARTGNEIAAKLLVAYGAEAEQENRWGQNAAELTRLREKKRKQEK